MQVIRWVILGLFLSFSTGLSAAPLLTQEEKQWISNHPVITYTYTDAWPVDYQVNGNHVGLMRDYLDAISGETGLRFQPVYPDKIGHYAQAPRMISAIAGNLASEQLRNEWRFTAPFTRSSTVVLTRTNSPGIYTLSQLAGKRIAIRKDSFYEHWLRQSGLNIQVQTYLDIREALREIEEGRADAALGTELSMRPLQQRFFPASLGIAGVLSDISADISMAVRPEDPLLLSILNKALGALTAGQTDTIYAKWIDGLHLGSPSLSIIFFYYRTEILIFGALVLILVYLLRSAIISRRRAVDSENEKSRFLAVMSHEIRTPMHGVVASLELLRSGAGGENRHDYIELAHGAAINLLELLNNVLDHSRLESGEVSLHPRPFALRPFINNILALHRARAEQKSLPLNNELASELDDVWICADMQRIGQILNNLLSNALKFTERGHITLSGQAHNLTPSHMTLVLAVSDTGAGIPEHEQSRLFRAWNQADHGTYRRQEGSGLGLYICHQLASLMQGTLLLHSQPGQGTTLTLRLPVDIISAEAVIDTAEVSPSLRKDRFPGVEVLVVEDHPASQRLLRDQLTLMGCEVTVEGEGKQALALIADENYFDIILLDCHLPDMDGYEVASKIRSIETRQQREPMPVIAISAMSGPAHQQRCRESGMSASLGKPVRGEALAAEIRRWCPESLNHVPHPPLSTDSTELAVTINADIQGLKQAISRQDLRYMRHYAHRIRGVALMYNLSALEQAATAFEVEVGQTQCPPSTEHGMTLLLTLADALEQDIRHLGSKNDPRPTSAPV